MDQIDHLPRIHRWIINLFQFMVDIPGMHRVARLYFPLLRKKSYYCSYSDRFQFIYDTQSWFGYLIGLGLVHRDIDALLKVIFQQLPNKKIIFFDVGANEGFVTLLAHSQAQAAGCLLEAHCFDPNPYAFARLMQNIHLNSFQTQAYQIAVGESSGKQEMLFTQETINSTLLSKSAQEVVATEMVEVTTIDQFCVDHDLVPDIMKIDVEGYEPYLLRGAETILRHHKPYLLVEVNNRMLEEGGNSAEALIVQLRELGYDLYYIDSIIAKRVKPQHPLKQSSRWPGYYPVENGDQVGRYLWDVLAVPGE